MKKHVFGILMLLCTLNVTAQNIHIQIPNPDMWSAQELEPYIGKTVIFDDPIVVCSNAYSGSYTVAPRRTFTPSNQALPNTPEYTSVVSRNAATSMSLTGFSGYHRCGEKIHNLTVRVKSTSSLEWISGTWIGNTREEMENTNVRRLVNIDGCDSCLLICAMNLEYYLTANTGSGSMGPSTYAAHQIQRTKVNKALTLINADAYGLVEIEQGQEALAEIASDLNAKLPGRHYTYINDGGSPSGTYTKSAFIYDANVLEPIGALQELNTKVQNRKKMMCFEHKLTGERFIYSINHFKAKSGAGSGLDADQGDGQGAFNNTRVIEAQAVIDHYRTRFAPAIKENDILIMGDLNAYAKEDPIQRFIENGMVDLHRAFHADSSYSYQFGGLAGYLDHALCNSTLYKQVKGVTGFHINSDEQDYYTYDKSGDNSMFRSSDHDPVLVGLKLDSTITYDPTPTLNNIEVMAGESKELIIRNAFKDSQKSYYTIVSINGLTIEHKEITSPYQEISLPEAAGLYLIFIYADGKVYQKKFIVR